MPTVTAPAETASAAPGETRTAIAAVSAGAVDDARHERGPYARTQGERPCREPRDAEAAALVLQEQHHREAVDAIGSRASVPVASSDGIRATARMREYDPMHPKLQRVSSLG